MRRQQAKTNTTLEHSFTKQDCLMPCFRTTSIHTWLLYMRLTDWPSVFSEICVKVMNAARHAGHEKKLVQILMHNYQERKLLTMMALKVVRSTNNVPRRMPQKNQLCSGLSYWSELPSTGRITLNHDESSMVAYIQLPQDEGGASCSCQGNWLTGNSIGARRCDCAAGRANGVDLTSATSASRSYLTGVLETWLAADGSVVTTHKGESTEEY